MHGAFVQARHIADRLATVGEEAEGERSALRPLPTEPFDPTVVLRPKADRKARISVRGSRYSVPASSAGRTVDVRLGGAALTVHAGGREVARHERSARNMRLCALAPADASGGCPALRQHLGLLDDCERRLLLLVRRVAVPVEDATHQHP